VLACVKTLGLILLCGDSKQIVYPNSFSWAAVRNLFWDGLAGAAAQAQDLLVLQNGRVAPHVLTVTAGTSTASSPSNCIGYWNACRRVCGTTCAASAFTSIKCCRVPNETAGR
jgi:hypothetical protein